MALGVARIHRGVALKKCVGVLTVTRLSEYYSALMSPTPTETIDLWLYADAHRTVRGRVPLGDLHRLLPSLAEPGGEAEYELAFDRDPKNRARVRGTVRAVLMLQCQRCLEAVPLAVDAPVHLVAVEGLAEAEGLPEECNPLLAEQPTVSPVELVEDELLLALPLVPMHPGDSCRPPKLESAPAGWENAGGAETRPVEANPFAVLASLNKH